MLEGDGPPSQLSGLTDCETGGTVRCDTTTGIDGGGGTCTGNGRAFGGNGIGGVRRGLECLQL